MVDKRETHDITGTVTLCETFSTEDLKLKQLETGEVYGKSVVDEIEGYDLQGKPYSRYTYIETDIPDIEPEEIQEEPQNE